MFYDCLKVVVRPIFYLLFRVKVVGKEHAKYTGKMILISNHVSNYDPIFVHLVVRPKVYFMAKEELFKNPLLRWLITRLGAFPVGRGRGDLGAIKNSFKILKEGKTLGIFPEGTRSKDGMTKAFQHGAAMIALRTDSPVLPIYLARRPKLFRRTYVLIGEPIHVRDYVDARLSDTESVEAASEFLFQRVAALKEEAESLCK